MGLFLTAGPGRSDPPAAFVPPELDLSVGADGDFVEQRQRLRARIAEGGEEEHRARSDLVAFLLARGFVREAASSATDLDPRGTPRERVRAARLHAAAWALSPVRPPGPEPRALRTGPPWAGRALFRAAADIRDGAPVGDLEDAARRLGTLPPALRARAASTLADAVQADGPAALVGVLLEWVDDPPARSVLQGRRVEWAGRIDEARAAYREAADARSVWGHRARLALIDSELRAGDMTPSDALQALHEARTFWRGPDDGAVLRRIQSLALREGRPLDALRAAAAERLAAPEDPSVVARRIVAIADEAYRTAATGDLGALARRHAEIVALARFVPGYHAAWRRYALRLLDAGAPDTAAAELAELVEVAGVGAAIGLWAEIDGATRERIALDRWDALRAAGRREEAQAVRDAAPQGARPDARRTSANGTALPTGAAAGGPSIEDAGHRLRARKVEAALEDAGRTLDRLSAKAGPLAFER